jgi:hypothetical protein
VNEPATAGITAAATQKSNALSLGHTLSVRSSLHQHYALLAAPQWQEITRTLISLGISDASSLTVRHAMISRFSPNPKSVGNGAPVTGTAIYLASDPAAWEKTWALWTGIVANVPGCMGVTGGWMVEPVDGYSPFVVYVGWESLKVHDAYHHTKHFRRRAVILGENNHGYREYGHVALGNSRAREANL